MGQKNLVSTNTRRERIEMVDWADSELSVSKQAEPLSLKRPSLCYKPIQPYLEEVSIKH